MPEKLILRKIKRFALIPAVVLALTGCAELPAAAPISPVDYQACLLTQDSSDNPGINDLADYAIKQASVTYGTKRATAQTTPAKLAATVAKVVKRGCSLVVLTGNDFASRLAQVAQSNRKTNFVYISEFSTPALVAANLQNLSIYEIDLYEVGIVSGFVAASVSTTHTIALACSWQASERYLEGVRTGASRFDSGTDIITTVQAREASAIHTADVWLTGGGCGAGLDSTEIIDLKLKIVDYGRDLYQNPLADGYKAQIVTTVIPQVSDHLMEIVASDLEGDFIGGELGNTLATYGDHGLVLAPNHEVPVSDQTFTALETITTDYEAGLKK